MSILKSVLGGLVGSLIGAFVWLGCESAFDRPMFWLMIVAGLFAGVGVRLLVRPVNRGVLTGGIAACCTIAGLLLANVFWTKSQGASFGPNPAIAQRLEESQAEMQTKIEQAKIDDAKREAMRIEEAERLAAEGGDQSDVEDAAAEAENDTPRSDVAVTPVKAIADKAKVDYSSAELVAYALSMIAAFVLAMTGTPREPSVAPEPTK